MFRPLKGHQQAKMLGIEHKKGYILASFHEIEISFLQILFTCCSTIWVILNFLHHSVYLHHRHSFGLNPS